MKNYSILLFFTLFTSCLYSQQFKSDSLTPPLHYNNIHVEPLATTDDATSFVIWVKSDVQAHLHEYHTEHVYIIEGNGIMLLGDDTINISPKDIIAIPPGTTHAAINKGSMPLKVLSIQAPEFKGEDRQFVPVPGWSTE